MANLGGIRKAGGSVNVRRLQLDVDKAVQRPDLLELAEAIDGVPGVEAVNITVTDIDIETVGTEVTIEGDNIDIPALTAAIENAGAAMHSIDSSSPRQRPDHRPCASCRGSCARLVGLYRVRGRIRPAPGRTGQGRA